MPSSIPCRFCGLALSEDDGEFHPGCVEADLGSDDRSKTSDAHPLYGSKPGPLVIPG